mgnify:CR=1 FL=1
MISDEAREYQLGTLKRYLVRLQQGDGLRQKDLGFIKEAVTSLGEKASRPFTSALLAMFLRGTEEALTHSGLSAICIDAVDQSRWYVGTAAENTAVLRATLVPGNAYLWLDKYVTIIHALCMCCTEANYERVGPGYSHPPSMDLSKALLFTSGLAANVFEKEFGGFVTMLGPDAITLAGLCVNCGHHCKQCKKSLSTAFDPATVEAFRKERKCLVCYGNSLYAVLPPKPSRQDLSRFTSRLRTRDKDGYNA